MERLLRSKKIIALELAVGIALAVATVCFQQAPVIIGFLLQANVPFEKVANGVFEANLETLRDGRYYLSVGNPREICEIAFGDKILATNRSDVPDRRNDVFLGAGFVWDREARGKKLQIRCPSIAGFSGFTNQTLIAPFEGGVLLHLWRQTTEVILAPVASFLLILLFVYLRRRANFLANSQNSIFDKNFGGWRFKVFAIVAFLYSCSLSLFPRLIIGSLAASVLHIYLRNLFAIASLMLFSFDPRKTRAIVVMQALLFLAIVFSSVFVPQQLTEIYKWEYLFFPLSSFFLYFVIDPSHYSSRSALVLSRILLVWSLVQAYDSFCLWTKRNPATAPMMLSVLALSTFYLRMLAERNLEKVNRIVAGVRSAISETVSVKDSVSVAAKSISDGTGFTRVSAYIDAYCVGMSNVTGEKFVRIMDRGYLKDTSQDSVINFGEGRGAFMQRVLAQQEPILRKGNGSRVWFMILPIGKYGLINLTSVAPISQVAALESLDVARQVWGSLLPLEQKLVTASYLSGVTLQTIRHNRGSGKWEEEFGSIFIDINDFSKYSEDFGLPFSDFVSAIYVPALIKFASPYGGSEHLAGDEVYLVITKDFLQDGDTIREMVEKTVRLVDEFAYNAGRELCSQYGFPSITLSIGANFGTGTIIVDAVSVRTSGTVVNHAKRLQEEAGKNGILTSEYSGLDFRSVGYGLGERMMIVRKRQIFGAIRVIRSLAPVTSRPAESA